MSKIKVTGGSEIEATAETRLVVAIENAGVNIGHRCGGNALCTTCRVKVSEGEPQEYSQAEYTKLKSANLLGEFRLSCQILCTQDMTVEPIMTKENQDWDDTGSAVQPHVTPTPPNFHPKAYFEAQDKDKQTQTEA